MAQHSVLLVRSAPVAWSTLRQHLDATPDIDVVGDVTEAEEALERVMDLGPDFVVVGVAVVGSASPLALIAALRERSPHSRFVLIIDRLDQVAATELLAMQDLGLEGQLLWSEVRPDHFHRCLLLVAEDGYVVGSRRVAEAFVDALRHRADARPPAPSFTPRELAVLRALVQGQTHRQIAETAEGGPLRVRTVERAVEVLEAKLGVASPTALGAKAALLGLVRWEWLA